MRLSAATEASLPATVARPGYDRAAQAVGIVHLGLGAFHRAHQAVYTDAAMNAGDRDWRIAGVSLRSAEVHRQLAPQDCRYTVTTRGGAEPDRRLVGALAEVIVAPHDPMAVVARLAAATTRIASLTITEKGYHATADGALDWDAPAIAADAAGDAPPQSVYGLFHHALARRQAGGLPGLTLLSCDNLAGNGARLRGLLAQFLERRDPALARWFAAECTCPSTMVDRIVPATTPADLDDVAAALGLRDEGAVITELFSQWVIEDAFAGPRPRWEAGGAQIVSDVAAYEHAKLRLLNGAHSALAYLGLFRGHRFVHEAIADDALRGTIEALMAEGAASLPPSPRQGLGEYARTLVARFANRALPHRLDQIAMDGSQKIPQRWLETLAWHQRHGGDCPAILSALAAWIAFVRGDRFAVSDPQAAPLRDLWENAGRGGIVAALFGPSGLFAARWTATPQDERALSTGIDRLLLSE